MSRLACAYSVGIQGLRRSGVGTAAQAHVLRVPHGKCDKQRQLGQQHARWMPGCHARRPAQACSMAEESGGTCSCAAVPSGGILLMASSTAVFTPAYEKLQSPRLCEGTCTRLPEGQGPALCCHRLGRPAVLAQAAAGPSRSHEKACPWLQHVPYKRRQAAPGQRHAEVVRLGVALGCTCLHSSAA